MKSVSNPPSGTTPDPRSLTDLWRRFDAALDVPRETPRNAGVAR